MTESLGRRLRRLRLARDLTLRKVGEKAGLSSTHLSELERDRTSPTVGLLARIAAALGEETSYLVEDRPPVVRVVRTGEARELVEAGVLLQPLADSPVPGGFSVIAVTLPPGAPLPALAGRGERCIVVVEGVVEVELVESRHRLADGDAFHFHDADCRSIRNPAERPARLLWVASPPAVL
jgi:transcriptional regulator with XRE-family HTH domain